MENKIKKNFKKEEKFAFTDCLAEEGGTLRLRELILRGYRLLPLAGQGVLVIRGENK
jgi:hypothetical protein